MPKPLTPTKQSHSLSDRLFADVDSLILAYLRVGIGVSILVWAWIYTKPIDYSGEMLPLYDPVFLKPRFLFKYAGFEWVQLWPGNGIAWHFFVTKIAAIMLVIGLLTRISAAVLCGSVAYVLLVERQIYLNHYYLLSCLAGLMVFLPAGRRLSVDSLIGIERKSLVFKRWQLWLLRFQVGIPYVYGAFAKMNGDWMAGQPAKFFLDERQHIPIARFFQQLPSAPLAFAWGGMLYDLLVVPMLLYRRTRWLAVLMSLVFHVANSQLFVIGVFPWFMLAAVIVFFPEDTLAKFRGFTTRLWQWWISKYSDSPASLRETVFLQTSERATVLPSTDAKQAASRLGKVGFYLAVTYVCVQLVLPLRHWGLPGNPSWNERGHRFAWRMMLRRKVHLTTFKVVTPDGAYQFFPSTVVMTPYQSEHAEHNPELVRQAAVEMKKLAAEAGVDDAKVYCLCLMSLNGRRPVPIIDPSIDLTTAKRGWFVDSWVNQEHGPLPKEAWNQNKELWWRELKLPEQFKPLEMRLPSELDALLDQQRKQAQNSPSLP
ncbi:MAG: HTTM domain-containing protein [Pirellulaceae bacterium]